MSLCNLSLSSPFNLIEDDRFPMLLLYMDYLSFVKIFKGHYTRLRQYQKDTDQTSQQQSWFEYLDAAWAATDKCLKELIQIAKHDLKAK
jgi:hypothetical protein